MSEVIRYAYGVGSAVCHSVGHALVRDLTNYYWHVEEGEFEKQQELNSLSHPLECSTIATDEFIAKVNDEFTTESSVIPTLKEISSKTSILTYNIDTDHALPSDYQNNSTECNLCLKNPSDGDSDHYRYLSFGKSIMSDSNNIVLAECLPVENKRDPVDHNSLDSLKCENKTYQMPAEQMTCGDYIDSWCEFTGNDRKSDVNLGSENNITEPKELQEQNSSEDKPIKVNNSELKIIDRTSNKSVEESGNTENEADKTHRNPDSISSTNKSLKDNIKEGSTGLEKSRLGVIETFSDLESICFDDQLLQELISEIPETCTTQDISTDINISVNDNLEKNCCLNALYFDVGDDMRDDILSKDQLQAVETGSVSDWLYSVTGRPVICLHHGDDNSSVAQEEIKCIQEQEKIYESCKATDEIILKQSYVKQWLMHTNQYTSSKKLVGDGDFFQQCQ